MNNLTMLSNLAIYQTWKRKSVRLMIAANVLVYLAHSVLIVNLLSSELTPDPHELWALNFLVFFPLTLVSIILFCISLKHIILIYSIREKQSVSTITLLLLYVFIWILWLL